MLFKTAQEFKRKILILRKERKLHNIAKEEISRIFQNHFPDSAITPETATVSLGHIADVIVRLAESDIVHFEIIADSRTVGRDINCLEGSPANLKICIILDDEVHKKVIDSYFHELDSRKIPHNLYHRFWLSDLLVRSKQKMLIERLRDLLPPLKPKRRLELNELRYPAKEWYVAQQDSETEALSTLQKLKRGTPMNLFVTGARGVGKSSFLNRLERLATDYDISIIKTRVCGENWSQFLEVLITSLQNLLKKYDLAWERKRAPNLETLVGLLSVASRRMTRPLLVVIDQFERLFEQGETLLTEIVMEKVWDDFSRIASSQSLKGIAWVISAREHYFFLIFPRFGTLEESNFSYLSIPRFTKTESTSLFRKIARVTGYRFEQEAIRTLVEKIGNHPQNMILCFLSLCEGKRRNKPIKKDEVLTKGPWLDVFQKDIQKLRTEIEKLIVFAMADSRKEACSFREIYQRVSSVTMVSESELRDWLRHIQNKLSLIRQPKEGIFEFFHPRFGDVVRDKFKNEFPSRWDIDRTVDAAFRLCHMATRPSTMSEDYWYPAAELLVEAVLHSSEYAWAVEKATNIILEEELARMKKEQLERRVMENWPYHDAALFLDIVVTKYANKTPQVDDDLLNRWRNNMFDYNTKFDLAQPTLDDRLALLFIDATKEISDYGDCDMASRYALMGIRLLEDSLSTMHYQQRIIMIDRAVKTLSTLINACKDRKDIKYAIERLTETKRRLIHT